MTVARRELWLVEARETIRLAVPLALMQLSQIAMSTIDVLMIGRLGKEALAGAALGSTLVFLWSVTGMGLVTAVAPLAAQAFGAEDPVRVRRVTRQGLWVTALIGVPGLFALLAMEPVLLWMGQPAVAVRGAGEYLATVAWSLPMIVGFVVLRCFGAALNRPRPALWMMLAGLPLNAPARLCADLRRTGRAAPRTGRGGAWQRRLSRPSCSSGFCGSAPAARACATIASWRDSGARTGPSSGGFSPSDCRSPAST